VLAVMMAGVDAAAFRAAQVNLPEVADVPVVPLTATRAADFALIAGDLAAAAWLPKPFEVDALVAAVACLTGR
jgi:DNA-binding response OmpR family regulator